MSTHPANDIEIYHARSLATFVPRTPRGQDWIVQKLHPQGWQAGQFGAYHTAAAEAPTLREWMEREGLVTEVIVAG